MSLDEAQLLVHTYDLVTQQCASHHYHRDPDGKLCDGVGLFRYIWPSECEYHPWRSWPDKLQLESRSGDWNRSPFLATSDSHVSVWRKI